VCMCVSEQVPYDCAGFLDRNKDTLNTGVHVCVCVGQALYDCAGFLDKNKVTLNKCVYV